MGKNNYTNIDDLIVDALNLIKTILNDFGYEYVNEKQLFEDTLVTNIDKNIKFIDYDDTIIPKVIHEHKVILNNNVINLKQSLCHHPTDDEIKYILDLLPSTFNDEYIKWIIVLNIMKGLNKYELWNSYCKKSSLYNENENLKYWNNTNNIFIDINYLVYIINTNNLNKIPYFETYKSFNPLTYDIKFDKVIGNTKYISEQFIKYDTIIIKIFFLFFFDIFDIIFCCRYLFNIVIIS
jgi:hypothetical protein